MGFQSQAEISVPVGIFQFKSGLALDTVKKVEVVQSLARVNELKKMGWTCLQQAGALSKCWIFLNNETLPANISSRLIQK